MNALILAAVLCHLTATVEVRINYPPPVVSQTEVDIPPAGPQWRLHVDQSASDMRAFWDHCEFTKSLPPEQIREGRELLRRGRQ